MRCAPARWSDACAAALSVAPRGTVALQVREKDLPARDLYRLALELREVCSRYGAPMIVNDRVDIALAARADGVHLPFDSIGVAMARRLVGDDMMIGASTHSPPDVASAAREGADFVVFGPVFDPISKGAYRPAWGREGLAAACRAGSVPVYALGGITPERARESDGRFRFRRASGGCGGNRIDSRRGISRRSDAGDARGAHFFHGRVTERTAAIRSLVRGRMR